MPRSTDIMMSGSASQSTSVATTRRAPRALMAALLLTVATLPGCWEQVSVEWFPQMKRQLAVQAFETLESVPSMTRVEALTPPDGTVAVGWADVAEPADLAVDAQEALANPRKPTLESLANGKKIFDVTCKTCHGATGGGDGTVAAPNGPIAGVLPIGPGPLGFSLATGLTDGHIYTTISLGRGRMPSYRRIAPSDRWDVVNYIRELNGQLAQQTASAAPAQPATLTATGGAAQ
ncbi:MAG: cytochrome c [Deltaproteobacteria bacterium]|nr:cytochrome c [Deltaproteobacteria bacterium]